MERNAALGRYAMKPPVYVCVWVRRFATQALLRLHPELHERPIAVLEGERPNERLWCCNVAAQRLGAVLGMTRAEAELTGAELFARNPQYESGSREALLCVLHRFTPCVEDASQGTDCVLVMELAGTDRMFGPPHTIAGKVLTQAEQIGLHANIAISAKYETAVALASCPSANIVEAFAGEEACMLAELPIRALPTDEDMLAVLELWGLRKFGDLAVLPREQLVARLGTKAAVLQALTLGERSHLFRPVEVVVELRETMRFDDPIELLDPLLFVLNTLLDALLRRAAANLEALAAVTVTLGLDNGGEHTRRVRPALATQDRALLLKLLQLDLAAHPARAGVLSVSLLAETGDTSKTQLGLFYPQHPEPQRMEVTLARIAAMVGEGNVGHPRLCDTHQGDTFRVQRFSTAHKGVFLRSQAVPALRCLRPPLEIAVTGSMPEKIRYESVTYAVRRLYGPWRNSGAWWSSLVWATESWDFAAESEQAGVLLGVLTHDHLRKLWRLDALYD